MKAFKRKAPVMGKAHFVRYAGVVGDYNPIHYDLEFAQSMKMPAVVAQGPLTCTLALDALAAEVGLDNIKGFSARVAAPMFPDMELDVAVEEDGSVQVLNGDKPVLTGKVTER